MIFSFSKHSPKINTVSPSCSTCNMLYDAYVMQNDVMMLCYAKWYLCRKYTHPCNKAHNLLYQYWLFHYKPPLGASSPFTSAESAFIFRCKFCIPLGTSLELLRLLLRRYKLCIPLGTSLELLRLLLRRYQRWLFAVCSAFLLERLWSRKLTLRSLWNDFFVTSANLLCVP